MMSIVDNNTFTWENKISRPIIPNSKLVIYPFFLFAFLLRWTFLTVFVISCILKNKKRLVYKRKSFKRRFYKNKENPVLFIFLIIRSI